MIVRPKKRKVLRYKKMKEIGLNENKIQFLFILDSSNSETYNELISNFNNTNVEVNIFSNLSSYQKYEKFNYFSDSLDILFEICETSFMMKDKRILFYDYTIIDSIDILNQIKPIVSKSKPDEISIVLAHCDTEEKKELLIENLITLKKQNQKIILSSHILVDNDIIELVDYFVCDKKNEMISHTEYDGKGETYAYIDVPGYHHKYFYDNHAFAVLRLMLQAVILSNANGYKISHLIHYDSVLYDPKVLRNHYEDLQNYDIVHYFFDEHKQRMDGNFFSVKNEVFLDLFNHIKTKLDFVKYELAIFENFLKNICNSKDYKIKIMKIESLFYKNIIDKIKMLDLSLKKYYSDDVFTDTFIIPSVDKSNNKYISILTNDKNVSEVIITELKYKIFPELINVFQVDDNLLNEGINVFIPHIESGKLINNESKFANCYKLEPELINFHVVKKSEILSNYNIKEDFITTIVGEDFSTVHKRCLEHNGCIVDLGCLYWDWSIFFLGKKRIIGVDPQENEIINTKLFKGAVSDFTGYGILSTGGETARIVKSDVGFPVLKWKEFKKLYEIDQISVLKINIEGGEYDLIKSFDSDDFDKIDQIAVSFHHFEDESLMENTFECLQIIQQHNYDIFDLGIYGWYLCVKKRY